MLCLTLQAAAAIRSHHAVVSADGTRAEEDGVEGNEVLPALLVLLSTALFVPHAARVRIRRIT
ncbi:hypothetical protein D3C71_2006780 [compost metagenome]